MIVKTKREYADGGELVPYHKLDGRVNLLVPTRIEGMLSGAQSAKQDSEGVITLMYEDGSEESAPCADFELLDFDSFFGVVTLVQDRARRPKRED